MNWVSTKPLGNKKHISERVLEEGDEICEFTTLCGLSGKDRAGRLLSQWEEHYKWNDSDCQECKRMYLLIKNL